MVGRAWWTLGGPAGARQTLTLPQRSNVLRQPPGGGRVCRGRGGTRGLLGVARQWTASMRGERSAGFPASLPLDTGDGPVLSGRDARPRPRGAHAPPPARALRDARRRVRPRGSGLRPALGVALPPLPRRERAARTPSARDRRRRRALYPAAPARRLPDRRARSEPARARPARGAGAGRRAGRPVAHDRRRRRAARPGRRL